MDKRVIASLGVLVCIIIAPGFAQHRTDISIDALNSKYRIIGKLGLPVGEAITVEGIPFDRTSKDSGADFVVQRVNGRAVVEHIRLDLSGFVIDFGESRWGRSLPKLVFGKTYRFEGCEDCHYYTAMHFNFEVPVGMPPYKGFVSRLCVIEGSEISAVRFTPADFVDRLGMIQGRAVNKDGKSFITDDSWFLLVNDNGPWDGETQGKLVEARGTVRPTDVKNQYRLEKGSAGLVRLEDQIGREVCLRGTPIRRDDHWWFVYRETELYVENMEKLPRWTGDHNWRPVAIRGTLEKARLPKIDPISKRKTSELGDYFIVRRASWEPLDELLGPERVPIAE